MICSSLKIFLREATFATLSTMSCGRSLWERGGALGVGGGVAGSRIGRSFFETQPGLEEGSALVATCPGDLGRCVSQR
jgi:hypothetical protein